MTTSARHTILNRLRQQRSLKPGRSFASAPRSGSRTRLTPEKRHALEALLASNRFELAPRQPDALRESLKSLAKQGRTRCILGQRPAIENVARIEQLDDIELIHFDQCFEAMKATLFDDVDIGITSVQAIILETGSLIVHPTGDEPRTLSLIPPVHVCVITEQTHYYDTLAAYLEARKKEHLSKHANFVCISSPSKTADIQQTLAFGAHGPKRVIVVFDVPLS